VNYIYLILFFFLLPLIGALWNALAAMIFSGVAWAAFIGGLMMWGGDSGQSFVMIQIPLLIFSTFISFYFSRQHRFANALVEESRSDNTFQTLKNRHTELKRAVVQHEKEENQSYQIYMVAKGLAGALSWKDMAPRLTTGIQKVFGGYEFLLYSFDEHGKWNLLQRRGGWAQEPPINCDLPDQAQIIKPPNTTEVVPVLSVPISSTDESTPGKSGALFVKWAGGDFTETELEAVGEQFGEQLGMTLKKATLFSQMEHHSRTDGLTGLLRRRAFMDRMTEEFKRAAVYNTPFSVMMVDIDHFKAVNDTHGHAAGDAVLAHIGKVLKESVYETDVVGRYGGEEFIILLPKADAVGVMRKAEALRQKIEREKIVSGFEQLHVTVSIGVAHFPRHGQSSQDLIETADKAMYKSKETGRNRVSEG